VKIGKNSFFLVKKGLFRGREKKYFLSEAGETAFEVSLDGSLTRSFEDMEFIVSLPILRGKGKSELAEFLPKKGKIN
jgi:hypothetical protein